MSSPYLMAEIMAETSTQTSSAPAWKRILGYLGGAFLGAVLLLGAATKVMHPRSFEDTIRAQGLDFLFPAMVVALIAFALEAGLGSALVLGIRRLWVLLPSTALVAFFLGLTGRDYLKYMRGEWDPAEGCGCFGSLVERTPAEAFWQDLLLMVPALLLAWVAWRASKRMPTLRIAVVAAITLATLLLAWKAPDLPLDNYATRLKPGKIADDLCAGSGEERVCLLTVAPELERGEHLVVMADINDEAFGESVDALNNQYDQIATEGTGLVVLSAAPQEDVHKFFWTWGPAFEIREAPEALLKPLYRTLPRSFRVVDGKVTETWTGLPPGANSSSSNADSEAAGGF